MEDVTKPFSLKEMLRNLKEVRDYTHEDIADALGIKGDQKGKARAITQIMDRNKSVSWEQADWILNEYFSRQHPFTFAMHQLRAYYGVDEKTIGAINSHIDLAIQYRVLAKAHKINEEAQSAARQPVAKSRASQPDVSPQPPAHATELAALADALNLALSKLDPKTPDYKAFEDVSTRLNRLTAPLGSQSPLASKGDASHAVATEIPVSGKFVLPP